MPATRAPIGNNDPMSPLRGEETLSERVALLEAAHKVLLDEMVDTKVLVREIDRRLMGRPSWSVTTYITLVTAFAAGLLGWVLSSLPH